MKIIVCGTRGTDTEKNYQVFDGEIGDLCNFHKWDELEFVHGNCSNSPDMFVLRYAEEAGVPDERVYAFPAEWDAHGKQAGFIRNAIMAEFVRDNGGGETIAFWDGKSNGTFNMIKESVRCGIRVTIISAIL
jgi:hypothetical protein